MGVVQELKSLSAVERAARQAEQPRQFPGRDSEHGFHEDSF